MTRDAAVRGAASHPTRTGRIAICHPIHRAGVPRDAWCEGSVEPRPQTFEVQLVAGDKDEFLLLYRPVNG
ncbi:MAG: hypothetical protein CYG59_16160 [Chloroflexi bacterium]|nr:MAG: hypothetical protein CYG59_16160 [Chloroflexota bacterium]